MRLQKIARAYWESAALMAAVELALFTAIAHGHDTIPAVGGLNEAVYGSTGGAHTGSEVKSYLQGTGFTGVAVHPFVPGVLSRVTGHNPS